MAILNIAPKLYLPIILIGIDVVASIVYGCSKDWRHCIYWAAAAVLTTCVTF